MAAGAQHAARDGGGGLLAKRAHPVQPRMRAAGGRADADVAVARLGSRRSHAERDEHAGVASAARAARSSAFANARASGITWSAESTASTASRIEGGDARRREADRHRRVASDRLDQHARARQSRSRADRRGVLRRADDPDAIAPGEAARVRRARRRAGCARRARAAAASGCARRDAGQKRSPAPPAITTACRCVFAALRATLDAGTAAASGSWFPKRAQIDRLRVAPQLVCAAWPPRSFR